MPVSILNTPISALKNLKVGYIANCLYHLLQFKSFFQNSEHCVEKIDCFKRHQRKYGNYKDDRFRRMSLFLTLLEILRPAVFLCEIVNVELCLPVVGVQVLVIFLLLSEI